MFEFQPVLLSGQFSSQIQEQVKDAVLSRVLLPGDVLPNMSAAAAQCGVQPNSTGRAYMSLLAAGILIRPCRSDKRSIISANAAFLAEVSVIEQLQLPIGQLLFRANKLGLELEIVLSAVRNAAERMGYQGTDPTLSAHEADEQGKITCNGKYCHTKISTGRLHDLMKCDVCGTGRLCPTCRKCLAFTCQ